MIFPTLSILGGILLLFKGADFFVKGGEGLAERSGLSHTTIGLTVIAFGTSLPELFVSLEAFLFGNPSIGLGNIIGSNIANIGLILALCMVLQPGMIHSSSVRSGLEKDILLMLFATVIFAIPAWLGQLDLVSGIFFLLAFSLILRRFLKTRPLEPVPEVPRKGNAYLWTILGLAGVILGAHLLLTGAVELATFFQIPPIVIGLSMVAVGTSLPEFATSLVAIYRGNIGISIGNIIGSNIFNLLFVLGIGSLVTTIAIDGLFDTLVLLAFSVGTVPFLLSSRNLLRWWGGALLVGYTVYIAVIYGILPW